MDKLVYVYRLHYSYKYLLHKILSASKFYGILYYVTVLVRGQQAYDLKVVFKRPPETTSYVEL